VELPHTLSRRRALAGGLLLVLVLAVAGRQLVGGGAAAESPPPFEAVALTDAAEEATKVLVHVVGAVHEPGLYELPDGSRIADALERAGGATPKADLEQVNLASPVADGTQVIVPRKQASGAAAAGAASPTAPGPVHLNSATVEELETLPGIGPVTAQKIVAHREKHGAFASVDELEAVSGIGPKRIDQLRDLAVP
jgi:competence protein ComEA